MRRPIIPTWVVQARGRQWLGVFVALAVLVPSQVHAQLVCDGNLGLNYQAETSNVQGSVVVVRIGLGAGEVFNGAYFTISQLFFDLDCDAASLPLCTDQGAIMGYQGDSTILNDCGVTVTSNNPSGGADPNHIVFTLTPPLVVPAGTPDACHVWFQVTRLTGSDPDATPYLVEERAGYDKAECDNGLSVAYVVTGGLFVATPTATPSPTPTPTPSPTPHCSITFYGQVTDGRTSAPIMGASVCLDSVSQCVQTDTEGLYDGLCYMGQSSADTFVTVRADGYAQDAKGPWTPSAQRERVDFALAAFAPTATTTPTPSSTATFTATATPTSCGVEAPQIDPVTSPTHLLQQTITGHAPLTGARWLSVCGEAGCVSCSIGSADCSATGESFQVSVPLAPLQVNHLRVCDENYNYCGGPAEACTNVEIIQTCVGDCGGTFSVTVDEILTLVNVTLGKANVATCVTGDANGDGQITVDEILLTVGNALNGCPT